jgi:pimeloyl-ACP methyl ester carboxylesterase
VTAFATIWRTRSLHRAADSAEVKLEPKLIEVRVPDRAAGAVLVLHGGASRREKVMVSPTQLSVLRMIPVARLIARAGKGELAVFRLLNSRRGWDTRHTPVSDAHWALDRISERLSGVLPTCLVGHSLGGRAAILASDREEVRSAAALAPWVYPTDVPHLDGQRILIVHGDRDRIASPSRAFQVAERLSERTPTALVVVKGGKHAMLARHSAFSGLAAGWATETLLGRSRNDAILRIKDGESVFEI